MRIHPWATALTTAALSLGITACGGGNQITGVPPDPDPTLAAAATVDAATVAAGTEAPTAPTPAPTAPAPTEPSNAATSPAPTPPPTTEAPATTLDVHEQFPQIFEQYLTSHFACQADPGACDPTTFLVAGSEFEIGYQERRRQRAEIGQYLVPGPRSHREIQKVLTVGPGLVSGTVCGFDADVRMIANETPERDDDSIIDETVGSYMIEYIFRQTDNGWLLQGYQRLSEVLGEDVCAPA